MPCRYCFLIVVVTEATLRVLYFIYVTNIDICHFFHVLNAAVVKMQNQTVN